MKRLLTATLIFISSFCSGIPVSAQEIPKSIQSGSFPTDTNRINELIDQSVKTKIYAPDSAIMQLRQALDLSKKIFYKKGVIASYLGIGICLINKRDFKKSKPFLDSAYIYCSLNADTDISRMYILINNGMAIYYTSQGNNPAAIRYYYKALSQFRERHIQDTSLLINLYSNIGATFSQLNQPDKGLYYLEKGKALALETRDSGRLADIYRYLAIVYENQGAYARSENYANRAIAYYRDHHSRSNQQDAYYGLGRNYLLQGKYEKALEYFSRAMALDTNAGKNNSPLLQGIGGANFKLKHYDQAEQKYKAALAICEREGLLTDRLSLYHTLAAIYNETRRYRLAYRYQLAFSNLYDSLYEEHIVRATNEMETRYRVAEKDKELARKQVQLLQQQARIKEKNIWIISISGGAALLIILLFSLYHNKRNKERLQQEAIRNLEKEKEINALRAKIEGEEEERTRLARDLHDGVVVKFSAVKMNLSVLPESHPDLADAGDFRKIIFNLDQATQELRKTAHNLMPDALLEGGLSEATFYFCKDLQQSSGMVIDFQQFVDLPRLLPSIELSLYRIVQELLQNVVKHASATRALVQLSYNENLLNITIEDNGKGFSASRDAMAKGIGIRNIYARMAALNGQVDIESREGNGTTVYLELDTRNYLAISA